jgi:hypothetical protein
MATVIPSSNLPLSSQPWGREIQKKVETIESELSLQKTNSATVDSQLQSSYKRLDETVRSLGTINVDVATITAISNEAVTTANAATITANNALNGLTLKANISNPSFTGTVSGVPSNGSTATSASTIGFLGMPQILNPASPYLLTPTDAGKHIYRTTTGGTITIPASSATNFEIGTTFVFINGGAITTTISINTDTMTLAGTTTTGSRTLGTNGMATAVKVTSNSWVISGNGLT